MNDQVQLTLKKKNQHNPKKLAKLIVDLSKEIASCKHDLEEIRNRSFFQNLFRNNTRDFADVLLRQNNTQAVFFEILQSIILINARNYTVLVQTREELKKMSHIVYDDEREYFEQATMCIEQAVQKANRNKLISFICFLLMILIIISTFIYYFFIYK